MTTSYSIEFSPFGLMFFVLVVMVLFLRFYGKNYGLINSDMAILLISTIIGYVFFLSSSASPSSAMSVAGIFVGLLLGILILLILQRVSPRRTIFSTQENQNP